MSSQNALNSKVARPRVRLAHHAEKPVVPKHVRALLGPGWIIEGEDPQLYEDLLAAVGAAVKPIDLIDWLLLKDFVDLTWEIQRARRTRESVVRMARRDAMKSILVTLMPAEGPLMMGESDEASQLALGWFAGDEEATERVNELLAQAGLLESDVTAQTLTKNAEEFDGLDARDEHFQSRRNSLLKQIERRRAGWAKQFKSSGETVLEGEFEESKPHDVAWRGREITAGRR